jgi:uncharacterized membrane protein
VIEAEASVSIDAPVGNVFAYMDDPGNQPVITPSLTRAETIERLPDGGKHVAYTYTMAGVDLDGHIEAVEYEPERRIRWEMSGDLRGEIDWEFDAEDGATRVTYAARYEIPGGVLEPVVAPFVERYNERELRTTLANLRTRLEHGGASY